MKYLPYIQINAPQKTLLKYKRINKHNSLKTLNSDKLVNRNRSTNEQFSKEKLNKTKLKHNVFLAYNIATMRNNAHKLITSKNDKV